MNIVKINGFFVPANDIHIEKWKANEDFTQSKCLMKFIDYCKNQDKHFKTIIDVGAWCGTWTKAMETFATTVVAFEPDPVHFHCLEKNCTTNCVPRNQAVGSSEGFIGLTDDDFTQAKRVAGDGKIQMVTIDSLEYNDVDLIKIDVEGYEMEVLKGAEATLENCKYIMIELNNNSKKYGSSNRIIEKYIENKGFRLLIDHWPDKVFVRR